METGRKEQDQRVVSHTPGPWAWHEGYDSILPPKNAIGPIEGGLYGPNNEVVVAGQWRYDSLADCEASSKVNAFLLSHAYAVPHDCTIPDCPGAENQRKLEAFGAMLAALKSLRDAWFIGSSKDTFIKAMHELMPDAEAAIKLAEAKP
jgi:hypothetical protein